MFGGFDGGEANEPAASSMEHSADGAGNSSSSSRSNNNSSSSDDMFAQLCSRMGGLTTDVKDSKPEVVEIFKSVLLCSEMEAQFFLESADWDIASAFNIYLENKTQEEQEYREEMRMRSESRKRTRQDEASFTDPSVLYAARAGSSAGGLSMTADFPGNCGWKNREVVIEGLDRATWRAFVSATTGRVYFLHLATNLKQECVPPGFADNDQYAGPFASMPVEREAYDMDSLEASVQSRLPPPGAMGMQPTSPIVGRFPPLDGPIAAQANAQASYAGRTAFGSSGGGGSSRWAALHSPSGGDASDAAIANSSSDEEQDEEEGEQDMKQAAL